MEPSQILDLNKPQTSDCCYSTRPLPTKRRHIGLIVALCILSVTAAAAAIFLCSYDVKLDRMDGGYNLQVARKNRETMEPAETMAPEDESLTEEESGSHLSLNLYPIGSNGQADDLSLQEIYDTVRPSVVSVLTDGAAPSTGTGLIIDQSGTIVTCAHVIDGAEQVAVLLSDDRRFTASVLGVDTDSDLALLGINATGLTAAAFGSSDSLQVGDRVVAIGDPMGVALRGTMTEGIISGENRTLEVNGTEMTLIQTNTALNAGNSGGPLINSYGQVVGINSAKIGEESGFANAEGLGFAIPTATVQQVVSKLLSGRAQDSSFVDLGFCVADMDSWQREFLDLPQGVYINRVSSKSQAYALGVAYGDLLTALNGVQTPTVQSFREALAALSPGDTAELQLYRCGNEFTLTIQIP